MGVFRLVHQQLDINVVTDKQKQKGIWGNTKLYFLYIEGKQSVSIGGIKSDEGNTSITLNTNLKKTGQNGNYIPIHCRQIEIGKVEINGTETTFKVKDERNEIK